MTEIDMVEEGKRILRVMAILFVVWLLWLIRTILAQDPGRQK